jgi:ABC-type spermidine/putrescine transport system permease subunit II
MVRRNIEPTVNAISTIIMVVTATLIYLADRFWARSTAEASGALGGEQS